MRLPRRPRLRAALACAIAALSLVWAAAAPAAPLPGSLYDSGDGNQDNALGQDWQGAYAAGAVDESPDANDDCFVGGVKELAPNAWAFNTSAGGCTPGKSNVRVAYANPESSAATTFGNFAFFRNDTTGNTFLTFELNQAATSWTNSTGTTIPCRSNGDLLLSFEVGGSSLSTVLYRWVGDGSGPAACPNGAAGTFVGSGTIPASRFQGAMNSAAASVNYVNPAAYGALFPANAFGEAAVDLPAVLQSMGQSPCFGFLQMHVHSRSSSSISSAMIDYTKPVPVRLQSCSITGTEFQDSNGNGTRDGGEPGVAGFEVYADLDDDGARDAGEPTGTSGASGFYRILGVPAGSYKIRQVARSGWKCSAPDPCLHSRSLVTGGNSTGNDFGNVGPSTAAGTAFEDLDADGTRDAGEPALAGVVAYADLDGDAVADAGEPSGTSDSAGDWSISDIPAGTHTIRTAARSGWTCSAPSPCGWQRTFSSGSSSTGLQFGEFAAASLTGNVFEDVDGDGAVQAGGDAGLAGWQVYLDANANDTIEIGETQTLTTAGGAYAFSGLAPGAYVARVTAAAANWYCTRPAVAAAACERASTLTSGQTATGQTFGVARTATVSGTKFNDIAGNGIKDGSDGALAGFEFWVDYDNDSALDAGEPSATSDAAGNWAITTARAGSWTLREVPNGAYQCTKPSPCTYALTLASNASASGYQFGNYVSRSVSGVVFDDADADGLAREAGEAGLAGWFVYSDANSNSAFDAGEPSSTSNSLGQYNLTGLANGNYRIRLVSQAGWTCSYPAGCLVTGSIGSGQSDTGMNFGVWGPSSIGGSVYEDADADGAAREAGEAGLAGRVVYIDANANAAKDAGEASATTDASGDYTLGGVNPGTYTLRLVATAGWTCSRPATCSFSVTTSAGSVSGRDFASYTTASVAGHVYEDLDADGARDGGEPAIAGRSVYLDADGDGIKDAGEPATTTDASGDYAFSGLAPAAYAVRQVLPAGWTQSAPASAQTIAARSGSATTATSLGSYAGATITGTIFEDADFDNSAQEAGDGGLSGRAVYLDEDGDATQDDSEPVAATGPSGAFTFDGLKPGAYTVRATPPAGWTCAYPASCAHDVTVVSRATSAGNDFGTYLGASVTGTVFEDADADGAAREAGEAGVAGRRVYLDADADATRDPAEPTTLTTASGTYEFTGVVARGWTVRLDLDGAWSCDSPAGCAVDVTLSSGSAHDGADFGIHASGSISGHLFTDRDDDGGPQVFGENDQPGRTVYADTDDDGTLDAGEPSATTDDRGDYTLADLAPGSYRVRQVLPAGWSCSTPSPCSWTTALSSRENAAGRDFSSWTAAAFSGTVFEDSAGDGEFPEPGEPGLAGRTIYIDVDDDAQLDAGEPATATDAEGRYAFTALAPGDYEVRAAGQPAGWTCSYPATCAQELTLEAGETAQDVSFGAWTTGTVAGVAYDDADASGSQEAGEPGIAGRTVWADLDRDGDQDGGEPAQVTDATGAYSFTLDPGGYMLREKAPAGWTCTAPALCGVTVTVTSRGATHDVDFGTRTGTGAVAGTIYEDADGDHTRDAGDDGVAAATVYVDGDDDGARDAGEPTQTTDADGAYRFASLPAGDHAIAVERPSGWLCITSGCARDVHVDPGDDLTGRDLALARAATISGTVTRPGDPLPAREV
jgi:protocatechuate 3,4-dioxygenase beta subunit